MTPTQRLTRRRQAVASERSRQTSGAPGPADFSEGCLAARSGAAEWPSIWGLGLP